MNLRKVIRTAAGWAPAVAVTAMAVTFPNFPQDPQAMPEPVRYVTEGYALPASEYRTMAAERRRTLDREAEELDAFRKLLRSQGMKQEQDQTVTLPENRTQERQGQQHDFTENEEYVLMQIAMSEAGDQDIKGKALVMNVILNRQQDPEFPADIEDIVMQDGQFEPVANGSFWEVTPDGGCVEALEMVKGGWDGSQGATYFEEEYEGSWHQENLEALFTWGCHTFYK